MDTDKITEQNWQKAVLAALDELPEDIKQSVGYSVESAQVLTLKVSVEPLEPEDGESCVNSVKVRWWPSRREELQAYKADDEKREESFMAQYRKEFGEEALEEHVAERMRTEANLRASGQEHLVESQLSFEAKRDGIDHPSLSIDAENTGEPTMSLVPELASVGSLKEHVLLAILEEMWQGGGVSMDGVNKDGKGRFIRDDGTYILDRQRPRRRRKRG